MMDVARFAQNSAGKRQGLIRWAKIRVAFFALNE
jgi:hypothetical protein